MIDLNKRRTSPIIHTSPPIWPVPLFGNRRPAFVPSDPRIPGVDIAYERTHPEDMLGKFPPNTRFGSYRHFMPSSTPVFAVRSGVVRHAARQLHGYAVMIDHKNRWATYYANLEHIFILPNEQRRHEPVYVNAGDVIGYVGAPAPDAMACLHFDLWQLDDELHYASVDPRPEMPSWLVLPWNLTPTGRFERALA